MKKWFLRYWLLFFFMIVIGAMFFFKLSFKDIYHTIKELEIKELMLLVAIYFLISFLYILNRKYLLYAMHFSASIKNLTFIHFSTMAAHYSTPAKIGFPLSIYLLKHFENIPYSHGTAVVIIELVISTGLCGIIGTIGSFIYFDSHAIFFPLLIFVLISAIVFLIVIMYMHSLKENSRFRDFLIKFSEAFSYISRLHLMVYIFITFIYQILSTFSLIAIAFFFSEELSVWQALVATCASFFMGAISMIPMGLGTRDASMLFYLNGFGISAAKGISMVTIQRLLSTGLSFLLGVIFGAILGIKHIQKEPY